MSLAKRLAIIIPSYGRTKALCQTLNKMLVLKPCPDEIWVMEQSKNIEADVVKACEELPCKIHLRHLSRPGAQAARNQAARESSADILLFLDDDVDPEPRLVEAHLENYRDPTIHAVAGFYLEPGESETSQPKDDIWWRPLTQLERYPASYSKRVDSPLWPSCNGSIRREVFLKLGGFDENYRYTLLDDTDLAVRMQKAGFRCVHDSKARLFHRKEPSGGNRPTKPGDRVIASREKWYTWTYFFLVNYGALGVPELIWRIRRNIFRKAYFKNLYLLKISCLEALIGVIGGLQKALSGRKTIKL
jgi:GT2 family glycosyltransferase